MSRLWSRLLVIPCILTLIVYLHSDTHTAPSSLPPTSNASWVAFGDSITVGLGASTPERSFIKRIERITGSIDNRAESATRIRDQLSRIKSYQGNADSVIWLTGYNDMRAGTARHVYRALLKQSLDLFSTRRVTVYLGLCLSMTPTGYTARKPNWNHGSNMTVQAFNQIIRQTAQRYPFVRIVDTSFYTPASGVSADQVHPNDLGHQQIANAFLNVIQHKSLLSTPR